MFTELEMAINTGPNGFNLKQLKKSMHLQNLSTLVMPRTMYFLIGHVLLEWLIKQLQMLLL